MPRAGRLEFNDAIRVECCATMSDVTQILSRIDAGDTAAAERLLPLVYNELRALAAAKLAQERPGQTLQATALVHEAYVRLVDVQVPQQWQSRAHFFAAAAEAMRRILIEHARRKAAVKRGGGRTRVGLEEACPVTKMPYAALLDLDEALSRFASSHPRQAELVKLRFFGGLKSHEAAQALGVSNATAERYWSYARSWLYCELKSPDGAPQSPNR